MTRLDQFHEISSRQVQACESLAITTRDQSRQLRAIEGRLPAIEQRIETVALTSHGAHVALCMIVALLEQMAQGLVSLQACVLGWIALRSLRLDPTRGLPVRLEDAMGSIIELPLECLYGWQDVDYILRRRFEELGLKGYEKVLRRQYALEDDCSGRDLDRSRPPKAWLRPGMKVNMSMVFAATDQELTRSWCPRCRSGVASIEETTVRCKTEGCGMWFRVSESKGRIFELGDYDDDDGNDGMDAFQEAPRRTTKMSRPASGYTWPSWCEPSDFQRVRLLKTQPEAEAQAKSPKAETIGQFRTVILDTFPPGWWGCCDCHSVNDPEAYTCIMCCLWDVNSKPHNKCIRCLSF
ncbi:hypothetical protein MAPG_11205 [Magnaporthiopsis poae ATCC 64411]|uniref:RanBP2-type domain-containing protein n=1 Tax=Magnaporthiopsis poae (strain ATCC 64411 / 73-15) TaxID=644358 RepID=A0A0C4EEN1_MAGP6|nr:hypothetical protein MAPG_11205 [Magnaporthiopsis poae ATCC 64411]